jgi:hypothetical protein
VGCAIASEEEIANAKTEIRKGIGAFFALGGLVFIMLPLKVLQLTKIKT